MPSFTFDFYSKQLAQNTSVSVILPDVETVPENGWKVIYLLHGWSENHSAWMRYTSIERYANKRQCAVVMPDGGLSFYNDMVNGLKYFSYITQELPEICERYFRISRRREDNFIGGLSMGGCGSLTIGLTVPEQYAGIVCLSASNFPNSAFKEQYDSGKVWPGWLDSMKLIYGDIFPNLKGTDYDAFVKAKRVLEEGKPCPKIYHYIGLEEGDGLRWAQETQAFFEALPGNPFDYVLATRHGVHNWDSWDAVVSEGMDHVGLTEVK